MASIIIDVVMIAVFVLIMLILLGWMLYAIISYHGIIHKESSSCPLYSCGTEPETTTSVCVDGKSAHPMYAYRTNESGQIECQKDTASYFEQYKKNGQAA